MSRYFGRYTRSRGVIQLRGPISQPIPMINSAPDSFTESLRQSHSAAWDAATRNRFTAELVSDEIDSAAYAH